MASSPVVQLPASSFDLYGASVATATRTLGDPRLGVLYDNVVLAAGAPVHFHPVGNTKFLVVFSRIWTAATPSTTQMGFFSSYTQAIKPVWWLADKTGWRGSVGSTADVPIQAPYSSAVLRDACSRAPDYLYLLHSLTNGSDVSALIQHFQVTVNGRVVPVAEEPIPGLPVAGVVFDKGLAYTTPHITAFGIDDDGNVFMIRKLWRAIGSQSFVSARNGLLKTPWEFSTGTGWSTDPAQAAPEPGLTSAGPLSHAVWRNSTYLATVVADGNNRSAQVFSQMPGNPWKKVGMPVAMGSTADGTYLGGTLQLQSMLGATPALVTTPSSETAFPYCFSKKARVSSQDSLVVTWGLFQVPRQV